MADDYKSKRSDSVLTPEIRWAYPWVHEQSTKRANGKPRTRPIWVISGLLPKLHTDPMQCPNYKFLSDMLMQAVVREPLWNGQFPAGGYWPIQDGDAPPKPAIGVPGQPIAPVDPNKGAWRRGHWIFEASTGLPPGPKVCVMQNGTQVEIPARTINGRQMYKSGDFGFGSIHAWTFWNDKWGVNIGFEGILWTREGEPIGTSGARSAASMFGSVAGTAAPAAAPQPGAGAPVMQAPAPTHAPAAAPQPQYAAPVAPQYAPPAPPAPPSPPAPIAVAPPLAPAAAAPPAPPMPPAPPAPSTLPAFPTPQ